MPPRTMNIRVIPNAGRNEVSEEKDGSLKVRVTAPPERGRANKAAVKLLAESLGVRKSAVKIVKGEKSRDKTVEVAMSD